MRIRQDFNHRTKKSLRDLKEDSIKQEAIMDESLSKMSAISSMSPEWDEFMNQYLDAQNKISIIEQKIAFIHETGRKNGLNIETGFTFFTNTNNISE